MSIIDSLNFMDKFGNEYSCTDTGVLYLSYATSPSERRIGSIKVSNNSYHKFVKPIHLHRNLNGWGVPKEVMERLPTTMTVHIHVDSVEKYVATVRKIMEFGVPFQFNKAEEQLIMPIRYWKEKASVEEEI